MPIQDINEAEIINLARKIHQLKERENRLKDVIHEYCTKQSIASRNLADTETERKDTENQLKVAIDPYRAIQSTITNDS